MLDGTCSDMNTKDKKPSFGHNPNISALQRNIDQSRSQDYPANNDPLEQIDKIELVQQSDSTVHLIADEEVSTDNNLSCLSIAPIQNLLGVFNENMDETKTKNNSPNGVEQYDGKTPNVRDEESARNSDSENSAPKPKYESKFKLELPEFQLSEKLRLNLPQPVIDRCSFYSIIHGVNKAVQDMAAEDQHSNIEETKDEDSALVRAVNGPTKSSSTREGPQVEMAVLDEEKFLLAAIENRKEGELRIRACPITFAEAIGEVEPAVVSESAAAAAAQYTNKGQSENPMTSSRTQLWKPSRSWWEAKSGKNPWIDPSYHNKRWRYLWPLIHYHKFLAKCIKKLKRNNVDVKTSLSPVSAFLREEVCAVSDHLAATSKWKSDEWMEGIPHFYGWTAQDEESQEKLSQLVRSLPMRSLVEPADVDSPLLRDQIDVCFLKAWKAQRDQMENGGQERIYDDNKNKSEYKAKGRAESNQSFMSSTNGSRPPRHGGSRGPRSNRMTNNQRFPHGSSRHWRHQRGNRMYGGYPPHDQSMMMPPHMQHGMYHPPQYNPSFHGSYVPGHYMSQSMNNSIVGWNHPYGGNDYSNLNISVSGEWDQFHGNQYDPSMENGSFYGQCDDSVANTSVASFNNFEGAHFHTQVPPVVPTISQRQVSGGSINTTEQQGISNNEHGSFEGASNVAESITGTMQTPAKEAPRNRNTPNLGTPASPSWAHLHMVPGLATPLTQQGGLSGHQMTDGSEQSQNNGAKHNSGMRQNQNWANAKPLFINPNFNHHFPQGGPVPPSPATQFTMSPQANSQNTAYFAHGYSRPNPPMQHQMNNFAPPMHQNYPETLNETVLNDGQTLTEETSSETTSDTEN